MISVRTKSVVGILIFPSLTPYLYSYITAMILPVLWFSGRLPLADIVLICHDSDITLYSIFPGYFWKLSAIIVQHFSCGNMYGKQEADQKFKRKNWWMDIHRELEEFWYVPENLETHMHRMACMPRVCVCQLRINKAPNSRVAYLRFCISRKWRIMECINYVSEQSRHTPGYTQNISAKTGRLHLRKFLSSEYVATKLARKRLGWAQWGQTLQD